ncbi:hypothetical protein Tco_0111938 [Tanacetum coccineum]
MDQETWLSDNVLEDFQLGIESYQTLANTSTQTSDGEALGFEFKHDFTIIDSPRAVFFFRDKFGVQDDHEVQRLIMGMNARFGQRKIVDISRTSCSISRNDIKDKMYFRESG